MLVILEDTGFLFKHLISGTPRKKRSVKKRFVDDFWKEVSESWSTENTLKVRIKVIHYKM